MRAPALLFVLVIVAAGCPPPGPPDPTACANSPTVCGPNMWCDDTGSASQCRLRADGGSDAVVPEQRVESGAADGVVQPGHDTDGHDASSADASSEDSGSPDLLDAGPAPQSDAVLPPEMGPVCANLCTVGQRRCQGGIQECGVISGCAAWGPANACLGAMTCQTSGTSATCACPAGACTQGSQGCGPGGGVRTCVLMDGCPAWGPETACGPPRTCRVSGAAASCACSSNSCALGAQQCGQGGGTRTCVSVDGCPTWGPETSCSTPKTCTGQGANVTCACQAASHTECTGNTCGLRVWTFESGSNEGAVVDPAGVLTRAVHVDRGPGGSWSLALPVRMEPSTYFFKTTLPVCGAGNTADFYGRRFSARIYVDGTYDPGESMVLSVGPEVLYLQDLPSRQWITLTGRFDPQSPEIPLSAFRVVKELTFSFQLNADGLGGAFFGTIWMDDIRVD